MCIRLVGSEMCIRDSHSAGQSPPFTVQASHHYSQCRPVTTIHSAGQSPPFTVQASHCHTQCRPVTTIHSAGFWAAYHLNTSASQTLSQLMLTAIHNAGFCAVYHLNTSTSRTVTVNAHCHSQCSVTVNVPQENWRVASIFSLQAGQSTAMEPKTG